MYYYIHEGLYVPEDFAFPVCTNLVTGTETPTRDSCQTSYQSFNEVLCECQMDYAKECG